MYSGLGFSITPGAVDSWVNISEIDDFNKTYSAMTLPQMSYSFGLYYKGFSIRYAPKIKTHSHEDQLTDNYSSVTGLNTSYYHKRIGAQLYWQSFYGYNTDDFTKDDYKNSDATYEEYWAQEMTAQNRSLNIMYLLLGKRTLSDYFHSPTEIRRSKIGLYGIMSFDRRKVYNTEDLFIEDAKADFPELANGFTFNQWKGDLGIGSVGTVFLGNFYLSLNLAFSYGIVKVDNTIDGQAYNKIYSDFDLLNFSYYLGYQAKAFKFELGVIIERDSGRINDTYEMSFQSNYIFGRLSFRFPTKEEARLN